MLIQPLVNYLHGIFYLPLIATTQTILIKGVSGNPGSEGPVGSTGPPGEKGSKVCLLYSKAIQRKV